MCTKIILSKYKFVGSKIDFKLIQQRRKHQLEFINYYLVQPRHIDAKLAAVLATSPALTTLLVDCKDN